MDKFEALEEFGLTNKEAKIYVKLLELGQATASELAKCVNILRPTVYDILDEMIKKGVVTYAVSGGRKVFSALQPKALQEVVESRKRILAEFLPELEELSKTNKEPQRVETYVGAKGVKNIFDDVLAEGKDLYHIFNYEEYKKLFQLFFIQNFIKKRVEKRIWFRAIVNGINDPALAKSDERLLREIRTLEFLDKFKTTIMMYGSKTAFISFTETPTGILIKNDVLSSSLKILFGYLWQQAEKA